jgi:hypothetical protein
MTEMARHEPARSHGAFKLYGLSCLNNSAEREIGGRERGVEREGTAWQAISYGGGERERDVWPPPASPPPPRGPFAALKWRGSDRAGVLAVEGETTKDK